MTDSTENDRKHMFQEVVRNVELCAELVSKQLKGDERNSQLQELKTVMLEYCDLDNNWKMEKPVLSEIDRSLAEVDNTNKIDEMYANLRRKQSDADPQKHEWYLNLEKKIRQWTVQDDPDCALVNTGSMTQSLLDPFTKRRLEDPVRSTCCGHSYERVAVLSILKKKGQIRCPVVGCAYQGYFNESHLEDDSDLLRQLEDVTSLKEVHTDLHSVEL